MLNRYAIIDLGTNTFHLLVAEQQLDNSFKELYRKRYFVKLAEKGIETIGQASLQRGLVALQHFRQVIDKLQVKKVKAIGTAALRTATNGPAFVQQVKEELNISIELITGSQEAAYIHQGVAMAVPFQEENYLLMDIGGGSVEFIIANKETVHWAESFPIGVGVLYKKFHQHKPILPTEITAAKAFIDRFLNPLQKALQQFPASILVGASGTFEVLEFLLAKDKVHPTYAYVNVSDFHPFYQKIRQTTIEERLRLKEIPDTRADMIVVAVILIDYIINLVDIKQIIVSKYAMKEGILAELLRLV